MTIRAYHFINDDLTLNHDMSHITAYEGLELEYDGKIDLCNTGLHASIEPLNALQYASGYQLCIVEMSGDIIHDNDKLVASKRKIIKIVNLERTLHDFAIWCAEQVLTLVDNPDPRSLKALEVKRLWLDGKATDEELDAAWAAARAAAWAARDARAARAAQNQQLKMMIEQAISNEAQS